MTASIPGSVVTAFKRATRVLVVTGAGISAESGVPTFRGKDGVWRNHKAEELATLEAFQRSPHFVWEWYDWLRGICALAKPNPAHQIVAAMEQFYHHFLLVTQNVDGLHARAGSRRSVEVHGSLWRAQCMKCGVMMPLEECPLHELPPIHHENCGGTLRPAIVWYGENYAPQVLDQVFSTAEGAQLVLVVGTSGGVALPVDLVAQARQAGGTVVEVNCERTPVSKLAHARLEGRAGEILPELWRRVQLAYLTDEIRARANRKAGRFMISIAGPPGAGKSTLAYELAAELGKQTAVVPLDGFHFRNARLEALGLRDRKGSPETFDKLAFELTVKSLSKAIDPVSVPIYSREVHEPLPDALTVESDVPIVIVEGNYLLNWPEVRDLFDLKLYVDCDVNLAKEGLIGRHRQGNTSLDAARRKYEQNDRLNRETVESVRDAAQLLIRRDAVGWTVVRAGRENPHDAAR